MLKTTFVDNPRRNLDEPSRNSIVDFSVHHRRRAVRHIDFYKKDFGCKLAVLFTIRNTKMKRLFFGLGILIGLSACNVNPSYTVYVRNATGEDLTIAYKSINDVRGVTEETIMLKDGAGETIIRTYDLIIPEGGEMTRPIACEFVAEYMKFTIRDNVESNIKWCDPAIKLETMDIGQEEFGLEFRLSDFPLE